MPPPRLPWRGRKCREMARLWTQPIYSFVPEIVMSSYHVALCISKNRHHDSYRLRLHQLVCVCLGARLLLKIVADNAWFFVNYWQMLYCYFWHWKCALFVCRLCAVRVKKYYFDVFRCQQHCEIMNVWVRYIIAAAQAWTKPLSQVGQTRLKVRFLHVSLRMLKANRLIIM